jgi:GT2 family glycosyltransferase
VSEAVDKSISDDDQPSLVTEKNAGVLCVILLRTKAAVNDPTINNYRIVIVYSSGNNYGGAAGLNRQLL